MPTNAKVAMRERKKRLAKCDGQDNAKKHRTGTRCDASDAILSIEEVEDGKLRLTMADGWDDVLPKKGEDDPGLLIMWNNNNMAATVQAANDAEGEAPEFFGDRPFSVEGTQLALLHHMHTAGRGGGVVGNCVIAPNDLDQYCNVRSIAFNLGSNPFLVANAVCPIGHFYVLANRKNPNTATPSMVPIPPPGMVPLFA
jgi:hypothetical protein